MVHRASAVSLKEPPLTQGFAGTSAHASGAGRQEAEHMPDSTSVDTARSAVAPSEARLSPAGLQSRRTLAWRRAAALIASLLLMALLTAGIVAVFGAGGWSTAEIIILVCFLLGAPWSVMGVTNSVLGLWLLHGRKNGALTAAPHLAAAEGEAPIRTRTAVAMTVRNEAPEAAFAKLVEVRRSLDATGEGAYFDLFVLSDTSDPAIAAAEEALFEELRPRLGGDRALYRRRTRNTGFKAGNVREFLMNEGRHYPFYLPLDADSLMSGPDILRLVRVMEAYPRIGILQTLAVGMPSKSLFARLFQFGMRHGMRSFTMGAAWWQGDCGPYWGHNALIRTAAFRRHCRLPVLPGKPPLGGHVLSHDQLEAAIVRRAGYEVRVLPVEGESFEENPPTVLEFIRRDLRWCQGNMQYFQLLGMKGLTATSRFQLIAAVAMYFSGPAWMLMTVAALSKLYFPDPGGMDLTWGVPMFFAMIVISLFPKLMGMLDVALTPGGAAQYGGRGRFAAGCAAETAFSILLAPVVAVHVTIFMVGLLFGRKVHWGGQLREAHAIRWREALAAFWPQTLFGSAIAASVLTLSGPGLLLWTGPLIVGLVLSIPFAVLTASPALGRVAVATRLGATPDEIAPGESLKRLGEAVPGSSTPGTPGEASGAIATA
ncbi:MAG: glucans biosynthesis glucosyltransferase MdoH [Pseudomonadota bacterium]